MKKKSMALAVILNIMIVGVGHVYLGLWSKGLILFVSAILLGIFTAGTFAFFVIFLAVIDSIACVKKINEGVPLGNLKNKWFKY